MKRQSRAVIAPQQSATSLSSIVSTVNGSQFDPRETVWEFRDTAQEIRLDFSRLEASDSLVGSAKCVLAWYAQHRSSAHLANIFYRFEHFIRTSALGVDVIEIEASHLINFRSSLTDDTSWYFGVLSGFLKKWYRMGWPGVSDKASAFLYEVKSKPNRKGVPVATMDPLLGPFSDVEFTQIWERLDDHLAVGKVSLEQYVLAQLFISLGQRSIQYASLKLCDFRISKHANGEAQYILRVPRAKQRDQPARMSFKERLVIESVGQRLEEHCEIVRKKYAGRVSDVEEMPIFPANASRRNEPPGFAFHRTSRSLAQSVQKTIRGLNVSSSQSGKPLNITTTRFRRTLATRAASEGHSLLVIAELLDHTDTQNAAIYINARPEIVERIDRAIALELAPLAQAFSGVIVENEMTARRGTEPGSRIIDPRIAPFDQAMGTCGEHGFCGLLAPIACYTCINFQPWLDGPHEAVLEHLIAERERLLKESDLRVAGINDRTILAVAEVVASCERMKRDRRILTK